MKLDIRQESTRHSETMDAITQHLGLGSYLEWDEAERVEFLTKELQVMIRNKGRERSPMAPASSVELKFLTQPLPCDQSRRPLVPVDMPMSDEVKEVLDTFRIAARLGKSSLGAYVISMAKSASDVLLVELLQREAAMQVK